MRFTAGAFAVAASLAAASAVAPALAQPARPPAGAPAAAPVPTPAQVQVSTAEARRLSDGFVAVADRVGPSVVQIDVTARDEKADLFSRFLGRSAAGGDEPVARGMGSGVVFSADDAVLTNNHVVGKVDATGLTPAKFADSDAARVGEWVVAIGSPFGLGYTVTAGVLSAKGRGGIGMNLIEDYLQTDASINPGNSGGPLCNLQGEVLGINTMIVGRGQGIGFAVPSSIALRVVDQIVKTGRVSRPWLGVSVQDVTPEIAAAMHVTAGAGALVNNIAPDGPAHGSNLRPGDIIAAVGGRPLHEAHDLIRETIAHEVGQAVVLEIVRGGKHYAATVTLTERPERAPEPPPVQQPAASRQGMGLEIGRASCRE